MANWKFTAIQGPGGSEFELPGGAARNWSLTFRLGPGAISEGTFTMDRKSSLANLLTVRETEILVRRNGTLLLRGPLMPAQGGDSGDPNSQTVTPHFTDLRGRFDGQFFADTDTLSLGYTGIDAGDIPRRLLALIQAHPGGNMLINPGPIPGPAVGTNVQQQFQPAQSLMAGIDQLAKQTIGLEWDVIPTPPSSGVRGTLTLWPAGRGQTKTVAYEYGGKIASYTRTSGAYGNAVRVTGGTDAGGIPLLPVTLAVPDITTRPEGRWDISGSASDITVQGALQAYAAWLLTQVSSDPYSYSCVLKPGAWQGPDDLWLGDTVPLVIRAGDSLQVNTPARCTELDITPGDDGTEQVTPIFGRPRSSFLSPWTPIFRRLSDLERHT